MIESKNDEFPVGTRICSYAGWVDVGKITPNDPNSLNKVGSETKVPSVGDLSASQFLGALGMPGITAYFAFLELCQPKEGETVLVNGAAGAVGSIVGQIAKIKGCKVVAYAGSDDKVEWLRSLGFDHVFNYKQVNPRKISTICCI